MITRQKNKRY